MRSDNIINFGSKFRHQQFSTILRTLQEGTAAEKEDIQGWLRWCLAHLNSWRSDHQFTSLYLYLLENVSADAAFELPILSPRRLGELTARESGFGKKISHVKTFVSNTKSASTVEEVEIGSSSAAKKDVTTDSELESLIIRIGNWAITRSLEKDEQDHSRRTE